MLLDNIGNNVSSEVYHVCNLVYQLMMTSAAAAAAGVPGLGSPASVTRTSSRVQHLLRKKAISEEVDISTSNATNGDIDPSDVRLLVWEDPGLII